MAETSVVIPCWITDKLQLDFTYRCIGSIRDTSDVELIVVNNGSFLGKDFMKDEADLYIENPKNFGYAKAINQGFAFATGKYLVAGNNDYYMSDGWEQAMIEVLNNIPEAGISCLHVEGSPKPKICWQEQGTPGGWWMIRKTLWHRLGEFDETFFNVFADYDLLWRLWEIGRAVFATPKVTVRHYGEGTLSKFQHRKHEFNRGQWLLLNKWRNKQNLIKYAGSVLSTTDIDKWLKENIEYSKSVDYSS